MKEFIETNQRGEALHRLVLDGTEKLKHLDTKMLELYSKAKDTQEHIWVEISGHISVLTFIRFSMSKLVAGLPVLNSVSLMCDLVSGDDRLELFSIGERIK